MTRKLIPARTEIPDSEKWNLTPLFATDSDWESLYREIEKALKDYEAYRDRLKERASILKEALDFHFSLDRRLERLYTYAHLKHDEDRSDPHYMGYYQRAVGLLTRASEGSSFLAPEIQSIPEKTIQRFLADGTLREYRFYLQKTLRYKPHTLSERIEAILAMSREVTQAPSAVFGQLDNVDLKFEMLTDASGNEVELSHGNFVTFLMDPDREIRKQAFFQYYKAYSAHRHTLAATLAFSVKKDHFYARVRRFETCRAAALFEDDVPEAVFDNLIETVKENLQGLFRYLSFRKQALKLDALHHYDTYVPIVRDVPFRMGYEDAVETCSKAMAPLSGAYTRVLKEGLLGGWVDRYENRGKRSGAYASGCYDSSPYILLNYEEKNLNSLYTLVHEAGHAMHTYYSVQNQPYVDYAYTIFVAEVASTFNEILLTRYLLDKYRDDPKMTVYILSREIDNIRATLIRQTMFAEFEKTIHRLAEENQPLTLEGMTQHYHDLLGIYFGDTMVIDPELALECLRIPHFYSGFYVYKYATGVSAAIALADRVLREGRIARNAYLKFLSMGGSMFPLEELQDAGIDMRSPEPIRRALHHLDQLVDRLVSAYDRLPAP